jgi:amino acid permease
MSAMNRFLKSSAIIVAATVGSGEFALPFIFYRAGWLLTLFYFVTLGALVVAAHAIYFKTLQTVGEHERLLGLARRYLGASGFWVGFLAIVIGLLLGFVIFLILGTQFLRLIFPALSYFPALILFWLIIAIPALVSNRRAVAFERMSVALTAAIVVIVFIFSWLSPGVARAVPMVDVNNLFLPFGVVLFAIAGWTGVEPLYESLKEKKSFIWLLASGTVVAALLYILFAAGIIHSAPQVASDTISGLIASGAGVWPAWEKDLVALLGLIAISTCSAPISHEIRNALEKDLHWSPAIARLIIIGLPLAAVLSGFNNFLTAVAITGGVFLSTQYLLIVAVGRRALAPILAPAQKFAMDALALVFAAVAVYSVWAFVVK